MKVMRTFIFLSALLVAVIPAQNASAVLSDENVYVDNDGKSWGVGHKTYDEVYVEWAVYEIADNPWPTVEFPAGNNFIYAYQIANLGQDPIDSFFLLENFGGEEIDWSSRISGTTAVDDEDLAEDVLPLLPCEFEATWSWSATDGSGFIMGDGGYSAFLMFASPYGPVPGGFGVTRTTDDEEDPGTPEIPEPASIALFGVASTWLLTSRRKKRNTA